MRRCFDKLYSGKKQWEGVYAMGRYFINCNQWKCNGKAFTKTHFSFESSKSQSQDIEKLQKLGNTPVVNYPPQCRDYKVLNEASRHYTQPSGDEKCDKTGDIDMSPQWSGAGWYRFTGAAGTKMATKKEVTKKNICGTSAPGHLDTDEHPDLAEGQSQDQKVCFYWQKIKINDFDQDGKRKIEKDQCYESTNITIQRCDGFYIYKLPKSNFHCENRYCGA